MLTLTVSEPVSVSGKKRLSMKKKEVTASASMTPTTTSVIHLCLSVKESDLE